MNPVGSIVVKKLLSMLASTLCHGTYELPAFDIDTCQEELKRQSCIIGSQIKTRRRN